MDLQTIIRRSSLLQTTFRQNFSAEPPSGIYFSNPTFGPARRVFPRLNFVDVPDPDCQIKDYVPNAGFVSSRCHGKRAHSRPRKQARYYYSDFRVITDVRILESRVRAETQSNHRSVLVS